jgi:hypothetical protein
MRIPIHATRTIVVATVLAAAALAYAGQDGKATEVLAAARKEIGGKKLDSLKSISVQAAAERNVGNFQLTSDLELLVDLPDKYVRSETSNSPMVNMSSTMGFNGNRPVKGAAQPGMPGGGGMIIRMGGPGMAMPGAEKLTPAEQEQLDNQMVRSARQEISRLMLGWFGMTHPSVVVDYTYAGEAESPDGKAFIVDAKSADGFAARLFIDEKTHLPVMVTYKGPQPRIVTAGGPGPTAGAVTQTQVRPASQDDQKRLADEAKGRIDQMQKEPPAMVEYTLFFDDWREEDGIKFPHAIRRSLGGTTTEEWSVNKVKVNPKIDPKKFESEQ